MAGAAGGSLLRPTETVSAAAGGVRDGRWGGGCPFKTDNIGGKNCVSGAVREVGPGPFFQCGPGVCFGIPAQHIKKK